MPKFLPALCALALLTLQTACAGSTTRHSITVKGRERAYALFVPSSIKSDKTAPLVLLFHGSGGNGVSMDRMSGFSTIAEREGFLLAMPDAEMLNWNDGREAASIPSQFHDVDDVSFIAALLKEIQSIHRIDSKRIYATGFSNGGIFAHYLASHIADAFAAIAPVSGGIATPFAPKFKPASPLSVLLIHGTQDPMVPFNGGDVDYHDNGSILSMNDCAKRWLQVNGITGEPAVSTLPDKNTDDACTVTINSWKNKSGQEVQLMRIEGGGHTWPNGPQFLPINIIGRVCKDFDAAETIWAFFKAHPKE